MKQYFQQSGKGLGSDVILTIISEDSNSAHELLSEMWVKIAHFEEKFSRFLPDSELTHVNNKSGERVAISPEFEKLLRATVQISKKTNSLYNPFILPALQRAGYVGSWPDPQNSRKSTDYSAGIVPDVEHIVIQDGFATIQQNSALDFGGSGKGYLLDKLGDFLQDEVSGYWLSLGGDILCSGYDAAGFDWSVAIAHANGSGVIGSVINSNGEKLAIATSGTVKRKGTHKGKNWHHLIDPRTGLPAKTDVKTATICTSSALEADVFAKIIVIEGSEKTEKLIENYGLKSCATQLEAQTSSDTIRIFGSNIKSSHE